MVATPATHLLEATLGEDWLSWEYALTNTQREKVVAQSCRALRMLEATPEVRDMVAVSVPVCGNEYLGKLALHREGELRLQRFHEVATGQNDSYMAAHGEPVLISDEQLMLLVREFGGRHPVYDQMTSPIAIMEFIARLKA